jgi:hypothetical protein
MYNRMLVEPRKIKANLQASCGSSENNNRSIMCVSSLLCLWQN